MLFTCSLLFVLHRLKSSFELFVKSVGGYEVVTRTTAYTLGKQIHIDDETFEVGEDEITKTFSFLSILFLLPSPFPLQFLPYTPLPRSLVFSFPHNCYSFTFVFVCVPFMSCMHAHVLQLSLMLCAYRLVFACLSCRAFFLLSTCHYQKEEGMCCDSQMSLFGIFPSEYPLWLQIC